MNIIQYITVGNQKSSHYRINVYNGFIGNGATFSKTMATIIGNALYNYRYVRVVVAYSTVLMDFTEVVTSVVFYVR